VDQSPRPEKEARVAPMVSCRASRWVCHRLLWRRRRDCTSTWSAILRHRPVRFVGCELLVSFLTQSRGVAVLVHAEGPATRFLFSAQGLRRRWLGAGLPTAPCKSCETRRRAHRGVRRHRDAMDEMLGWPPLLTTAAWPSFLSKLRAAWTSARTAISRRLACGSGRQSTTRRSDL
jgi:hypothetical protein